MFLGLLGCAGAPAGVWMFTLAVEPLDADEICASSVSHNFEDAEAPEEVDDDDNWSSETSATFSEQVFFGLIEESAEGAVLVVGDEVWSGTGNGKGWTFGWSTESWDEARLTHAAGYQYEATTEDNALTELSGTFDGALMSGEWSEQTEVYASWIESDVWSEEAAEVVGENGEMPSTTYLETTEWIKGKKGKGEQTVAAVNTREGEECSSATCTLSVTDACSWEFLITGERISLDPAAFDSVRDAGQAAGGG